MPLWGGWQDMRIQFKIPVLKTTIFFEVPVIFASPFRANFGTVVYIEFGRFPI
jgi:hypothetical protein